MNNQTALKILSEIEYATIATVDSDGNPWNTPVYCVVDAEYKIYWSSHPQSKHSQNIAANHKAFIVIYNSKAAQGDGVVAYLRTTVDSLIDEDEINAALELLGNRRGRPFRYPAKFQADGPQRIYKATPLEAWVNDADKDEDDDFIKDYRISVNL